MRLTNRWRWYLRRSLLVLAGVYVLGMMHVQGLIPYLTGLLAIAGDAVRTARKGRRDSHRIGAAT